MKPATCMDCPLETTGKGFVRGKFPLKPKLLIQGEAPGREELVFKEPFVGSSGKWLKKVILPNAGLQEEECAFDNTIRCLLDGKSGGYPTGKSRPLAETHCQQYDSWERFPEVPLLLVGAKAIGRWMGSEHVSRWHGHITRQGNRIIGCTFHPAAVMRNPNLLPMVIQEVRNLMTAARNPKVLDHPTIHKHWIAERNDPVAFDLEWDEHGRVTVLGIAYNSNEAYSTYDMFSLKFIHDTLAKRTPLLVGHNIVNADLPALKYSPKEIAGFVEASTIFDTMVAAHIVHPHFAELGLYGLSDMVKFYQPAQEWKHDKLDVLEYNGRDAAYNYALFTHLQRDLYYTDQMHLMKKQQLLSAMALQMTQNGVRIDVNGLQEFANGRQELKELTKSGFTFNPNSPKQIKDWAANKGIKLKDTTYETVLKHVGKDEEFDRFAAYREDSKSLSTWFPLEKDGKRLVVTDEYVYPSYHVTGTSVARPSCSNPNMLNIPEGGIRQMSDGKTRTLPNLRKFFIARDPDLLIYSFDFSQIENRMLAFLAKDKQMLEDFASGADIHKLIASRIYKKSYEGVTKDERHIGKTTVHATNYCEKASSLAVRLFGKRNTENVRRATLLQQGYFSAYPATRAFQSAISRKLDSGDNSLRNPFGRVRKVFAQDSHERQKRGVHFMGCSTAADLVNAKAIAIWRQLDRVPLFWVYDELAYELPVADEGKKIAEDIRSILLSPVEELDGMIVPVKLKIGPNYGELIEEVR